MNILKKRIREESKRVEAERQKKLMGEVASDIIVTSRQYKTLITRLESFDNEKTDAIRMALLYLEGEMTIDRLDKFIK